MESQKSGEDLIYDNRCKIFGLDFRLDSLFQKCSRNKNHSKIIKFDLIVPYFLSFSQPVLHAAFQAQR